MYPQNPIFEGTQHTISYPKKSLVDNFHWELQRQGAHLSPE